MKRIGILRGGTDGNYETSLKEGGNIISHIFENLSDKYKTVDILVDRDGLWHLNGIPIRPADLVHRVDVVWNTAQPNFASILQDFSIPSVGKSIFSRTLINSREMLREHMKNVGVNMPRQAVAPQSAREVFEKFPSPWIVKVGNEIEVLKTFDELANVIDNVANIIVEEFVSGKAGSMHSVAGFRGEDVYVVPTGNFNSSEKEKIISIVKDLHGHLDARHYLKSDFILHPRRGVFLTNIDFSPDLRSGSHLEKSLHSVGTKLHQLVEHLLTSVIKKTS